MWYCPPASPSFFCHFNFSLFVLYVCTFPGNCAKFVVAALINASAANAQWSLGHNVFPARWQIQAKNSVITCNKKQENFKIFQALIRSILWMKKGAVQMRIINKFNESILMIPFAMRRDPIEKDLMMPKKFWKIIVNRQKILYVVKTHSHIANLRQNIRKSQPQSILIKVKIGMVIIHPTDWLCGRIEFQL